MRTGDDGEGGDVPEMRVEGRRGMGYWWRPERVSREGV